MRLHVRSVLFIESVYLNDDGSLRLKPRWDTRIAIVDGNLAPLPRLPLLKSL